MPVSPALRKVEQEVDKVHEQNLLMKLPFAQAAWHFMSYCEDFSVFPLLKGEILSPLEGSAHTDMVINHYKMPFQWMWEKCQPGGDILRKCDEDPYKAAKDLSTLAFAYTAFESAFTMASREEMELELIDDTVSVKHGKPDKHPYEVYDQLFQASESDENASASPSLEKLEVEVAARIVVDGDFFSYNLNPALVRCAREALDPITSAAFHLPPTWSVAGFELGEFKKVAACLTAIAAIHSIARKLAMAAKCGSLGYCSSILLMTPSELLARLVRYSGVAEGKVRQIISLLQFGSNGIRKPDPALQPLIRLNEDTIALLPTLLLGSAMERNLVTQINKMPGFREEYLKLVGEKESLMREIIKAEIKIPGLRYFDGRLLPDPKLPDVDLAIICEASKEILIAELKWFLNPAEVREVLERSEEIAKGIRQLKQLKAAIEANPAAVGQTLGISEHFKFSYAVLSDCFIGTAKTQCEGFPVLRSKHFIKALNERSSLTACIRWIEAKGYLPILNKHFSLVNQDEQVGPWKIKWFQYLPLESFIY